MWTVGLTVEIKLRFQIPPAQFDRLSYKTYQHKGTHFKLFIEKSDLGREKQEEENKLHLILSIALVLQLVKEQTRTQLLFTGFKEKAVWIKWSARGVMGEGKKNSHAIFPSTLPMTPHVP